MIRSPFFTWMGSFSILEQLIYPHTHFYHDLGDYFVPYGIISLSMQQNAQKMQNNDKLTLKSNELKVNFDDVEGVANCFI